MKNTSIYIFFLVLALSFWNPLTFSLVYKGSAVGSSHIMLAVMSVIAITGIVLIVLMRKGRVRQQRRDILFLLSFAGLIFAAVVGVNLLLGRKKNKAKPDAGLVFDAFSKARYQTREFDFTVIANSLGLRDNEVPAKKARLRICCFGDSWTMGWGVAPEASWPKQLGKMLKEKGIDAEVINCGRGGTYPTQYREFVAKVVPVLKPDLVLVGVLQVDDLAQMYENDLDAKQPVSEGKKSVLSVPKNLATAFLAASVSNFSLPVRPGDTVKVKDNWLKTNRDIIAGMTPVQYGRYLSFDDTLRSYAESGDLNAGLFSGYINFPDRDIIFNDPGNKATQFAINKMAAEFTAMKKICGEHNCGIVMLNLPISITTGHAGVRLPSRDYIYEGYAHRTDIDSMYQAIATRANVAFYTQTDSFRALQDKHSYFYLYDGHPTAKGYAEIAKNIFSYLSTDSQLSKKYLQ